MAVPNVALGLEQAKGTVIGECLARRRADEFLSFLKTIDRETPAHLDLHLILDNYATHKTPTVKRWLARHKRFTLHFTPTSCSWLNLVERLFAGITRQRIRRGTFNDVTELKTAIAEWIEHRNQNPKPKTLQMDRQRQIHLRKTPPSQKSARRRKSGMRMNESEH
ncbi:MAG: IS630 family transposase [Xanthobacteraceae bacterium]|nr:IS630 family transposase [Xanthobacteraceae bacterium]